MIVLYELWKPPCNVLSVTSDDICFLMTLEMFCLRKKMELRSWSLNMSDIKTMNEMILSWLDERCDFCIGLGSFG